MDARHVKTKICEKPVIKKKFFTEKNGRAENSGRPLFEHV